MTKWDKYLVIAIILISLSSMIYIKKMALNQGEKYISIQINGEKYKKITFPDDKKVRYLDIDTEYGFNRLEIHRDKLQVVDADCPDKLDVKQGFIKDEGDILVCLPNRLVIEIKGENPVEQDIDVQSY